MIGAILKGYRILDKIKEGSVGTVWRAADSRNQVFALKQISAKNAAISQKLKEFKREATLTRGLQHRNIIRVYDYVDVRPQPFFVMEYFESENLKFALWRLPEQVYKKEFLILRQTAEALAHLHGSGVIHRDLKPENVLVSEDSEVRLIDFSIAQTKWDRLFSFGKNISGTPSYMAPEQIRGEKCDARTDIYSFGVLAYEILTKRLPFLGTTERSLLEKHLKAPPPPLSTHVKTVSAELDAFVLRLMAKNPADRFPDMTAVIHELSKWERKETIVRVKQVDPGKAKGGTPAPR